MTIWIYIIKSGCTTTTARFATSNETFSVSQTPSAFSSKVEDIEKELSRRWKYFWKSNYWCNILSDSFGEMLCPNFSVQFISSLWKIWQKNKNLNHFCIWNAATVTANIFVNSSIQQK